MLYRIEKSVELTFKEVGNKEFKFQHEACVSQSDGACPTHVIDQEQNYPPLSLLMHRKKKLLEALKEQLKQSYGHSKFPIIVIIIANIVHTTMGGEYIPLTEGSVFTICFQWWKTHRLAFSIHICDCVRLHSSQKCLGIFLNVLPAKMCYKCLKHIVSSLSSTPKSKIVQFPCFELSAKMTSLGKNLRESSVKNSDTVISLHTHVTKSLERLHFGCVCVSLLCNRKCCYRKSKTYLKVC